MTLLGCVQSVASPFPEAGTTPPPYGIATAGTMAYDQVIAEIPASQAATASAALALVNVELHQAKRLTEQALCAGHWSPRGPLFRQTGPLADASGETPAAQRHWRLQTLRHPQALACERVSRSQFFLEMSRHLPDWIRLRPAGQLTAFSRGEAVLPADTTVAARD